MRSFSLAAALVLVAAVTAACGDIKPCTNCPKMEGTWVFGYTAGTPTGSCSGVATPPAPGTMEFTRAGARIYTSAIGISIDGTIYEDLTFSMHGDNLSNPDAGASRIEIRGNYVAGNGSTSADGGTDGGTGPSNEELRGTYTLVQHNGTDDCRVPSTFKAVR